MPELNPEVKAIRDEFAGLFEKFQGGAQKDIEGLKSTVVTLNAAVSKFNTDELKAVRAMVDSIKSQLDNPDFSGGSLREEKSIGELFCESGTPGLLHKDWNAKNAGMRFERTLFPRSVKTLIEEVSLGWATPGVLTFQREPGIIKPPQRRIRVRDLIPFSTTTSSGVEFLKENVFTNAASPQEEGYAKGESALTFTIDHAYVQTIAHWIPATRQVLEDMPVLQSYINTRLLDGLADVEDYELLCGDNTSQHLNGLLTQATDVVGTYATASDTFIDQINNAITELEDDNYQADALILNPADWRKILKIKENVNGANTGAYVLGGPVGNAAPRLWDLPISRTPVMPQGAFLVGQFRGSVMGYDRMQSQIDVSNSHSDYFTKNKVAIRAEERITIAVFRPAAFRHGLFSV